MDNKSASTAIISILAMLPEDERYGVWKQVMPVAVRPELNDDPQTPSGTYLKNIVENARLLYKDLGISQADILQYLALELDKTSKEKWRPMGESYDRADE